MASHTQATKGPRLALPQPLTSRRFSLELLSLYVGKAADTQNATHFQRKLHPWIPPVKGTLGFIEILLTRLALISSFTPAEQQVCPWHYVFFLSHTGVTINNASEMHLY